MKKIAMFFLIIFSLLVFGIFTYLKKSDNNYLNNTNTFIEKSLADSSTSPKLIDPFYSSNHFIVADYVLSSNGGDMSFAIQDALNKCSSSGGGTVFLERGIYVVSKTIVVPTSCTLMGDWQDPDNYQGTLDYGTKIVVDVNNFSSDTGNNETSGLFRLHHSSGVEGLTIYYKNQRASNPVPQPWSFIYESGMLMSVKNVTLINSYMGIGRGTSIKTAHEMLMVENVKGTVLKKGVLIHNSADVGTITGLTFTPKYWANANLSAFNDNVGNSSESTIANAIKSNGGFGLMITDAEQSQFVNITLSGFKYGVYIPDANAIKTRYMGSGSFYNLNISDCETGIRVDSGTYENKTLIDFRWGYVISNSSISGTQYAIYNDSSAVGSDRGTIKLNDVTIKGKVGGAAPVINNGGKTYSGVSKNVDLSGKVNNSGRFSNLNLYRKLKNNGSNFTALDSGSSIDQINNALSRVSANGGGVVYLKPGVYRVDKSINVPANVELRGSSSSPSRYFKTGTTLNVVSNVSAIKLTGNNSGVYGLNIIYESNVSSLSRSSSYSIFSYSIYVENVNNIYIKNVSIAAASHGIYLNKCNNFAIENIVTGAIDSAIRIDNSSNGLIMNCLQNGTVITRNSLYSIDEGTANFKYIMNPNTKKKLQYIYLSGDTDIEIQNCFTYGSYIFVNANDSKFYSVNTGYDGGTGVFYSSTNSNGVIINGLKMDGTSLNRSGGSAGSYNFAKIGNINENDATANVFSVPKRYVDASIKLSQSSVSISSMSSSEISYVYNGDGKLSCSSSNTSYANCSIDLNKKVVVITPVSNTSANVTITVSGLQGLYYSSTSSSVAVNLSFSSVMKGDVNGNNKIDSGDYVIIRKYLLKQITLNSGELARADANGDGKVNSMDYIVIRKTIINGASSQTPAPTAAPTAKPPEISTPSINGWVSTSLENTSVNSGSATTKICNLGSDASGLQIIEYSTSCSSAKTANITNGCATITIEACKNGSLTYRLRNSANYSSSITVNDIGKYLIYGQVYNQLLYVNISASNNENNLTHWTSNDKKVSDNVKSISEVAIDNHGSDSDETIVRYLYKGILGRDADQGGLNHWIDELRKNSRKKIISGIINSTEAQNIYSAWGYN